MPLDLGEALQFGPSGTLYLKLEPLLQRPLTGSVYGALVQAYIGLRSVGDFFGPLSWELGKHEA